MPAFQPSNAIEVSKINKTPRIVHVINLMGLFLLNVIILLSAVIKPWHLIICLPILAMTVLYYPLREKQNIAAFYLAISFMTLLWIIICENIVAIDNFFGTKITSSLVLGTVLQSYVDSNLTLSSRHRVLQKCCDDPVSFNLKPGSIHFATYDCSTCNNRYESVADETGFLNQQQGLWERNSHIDLFVAGDSVMQGIGMPSVVESLRERVHIKMWNLSIAGYGPRQKINALITYALPKHPKWLIVEFYAGNDVSDAIEYELCEAANDFRCRFSTIELHRRALAHPVYRTLVAASDRIHAFDHYAENLFSLAVTRYLIHNTKDKIRTRIVTNASSRGINNNDAAIDPNILATPAGAYVDIRPGKLRDWVEAGMTVLHKDYQRLLARVGQMQPQPMVALLYNPTGYEIYRDILLERTPEDDAVSRLQIEAQTAFAKRHGWKFLDLTEPLRNEVKKRKTWIYGRHDGSHWSHSGTAVVASVLASEFSKLIEPRPAFSSSDSLFGQPSKYQ
jgi:hypothetical protein